MKIIQVLIIAIFSGVSFVDAQSQGSRKLRSDVSGAFGGGREFLELFKNDKNMDGKISRDELPDDRHQWIKDYDTDGDGAISRREARLIAPSNQIDRSRPRASARGGEGRGSSGRSQRSNRYSRDGDRRSAGDFPRSNGERDRSGRLFLLIFDSDRNGEISAAEILNASQALYKLDANGDKRLDLKEIGSLHNKSDDRRGSNTPNRSRFNGEGAGPSWQNFVTRIFENDKDGDGLVSREEMPKRMIELFELGDINNDESISRREAIDIYNRASRR